MFPSFAEMPFTYSICLLVAIISIIGFCHKRFYQSLVYHPYEVFRGRRLHTIFTSALVHQKWWHLVFNLYVFYGLNRDIELIIMNNDFSFPIIELITILVVLIGVILPNLISGLRQKHNIEFTSVGFSGAVFCSMGFSGSYSPLDESLKEYIFFPFLHYAYEFIFFALLVFYMMAIVFKKSKTSNHQLHFNALVIGCLTAAILHPQLIVELIGHIKKRLN